MIAEKIPRHILHIKSISKRLLLVTINCNPKITIICAYTPTEEASASNKDTFYNNLTDCLLDNPWVSTQSFDLTEQRQTARKKYQNHRNPENYDTWRNVAELANKSLVNDKINKTEQMREEADTAGNRNDTKELFNIVKKLNEESSKTSPSSVNKRNGEPPPSFPDLLDKWAEYFKELLNTNSTLSMEEIPAAEYDLNINTNDFRFE